jgi:diguanylate cyclase (GGDEF)-like protein/PAS domain S-box-containing protein
VSPGGNAGERPVELAAGKLTALRRRFAGGFGASIAIAAFGLLLVGLLWGVVFFKTHTEEAVEIRTVTKDTGNLARVFEEHVLRTVREADQVLQFIIDQHRSQGKAVDLRRLMEDGPIISRIYTHLSIADARGNLIAGSHPAGKASIAERDHFRVHVARDTGQLFIGRPAFGQASGTWTIQLSRRINNPDLSFGGVAVVSIDPQYFARLYSQTDLGDQAMITLVGQDGIVRARRARNDANATVDTSRWAVFKMLPSSPNGTYISTGSADGVKRIFSYRSLRDYPLVVLVGAAKNEALSEFHERKRGYFEAASLAALVIFCFTVFLIAMVRRQERMARALRRHNAELRQALEANTRLAAIVEDSNDAIISRALDGIVTSWNAGAERLFGYAAADAIGRPISHLILPPEILDRVAQNVDSIRRGNIVAPYETRRRTKDGHIIEVLSSVSPIRDEAGAVTGASVILRDISERRKAEAARAELAAIVEQSNDAIITRTPDGTFQSWNKGAERMFGYTATEAIGQPISLILPPEDRPKVEEKIERTRRGEGVRIYETRRVTKDGRIIDVLASVSPVKDAAGKVTSVSIIFHDISERKKADAAIMASEARLRAILDTDPECVKVIAPDGGLLEMNRGGLGMLEADTIEQVRAHGLLNFVLPQYRGAFADALARVARDETVTFEFEVEGLKGTRRWMESRAAPIALPGGGGRGTLFVTRDLTDKKRAVEKADYLAHYDTITGLPNRTLFRDRLEVAVARARRRDEILGMLRVNLDRFKKINESLGHEAGDALLKKVASRLTAALRDVDTVARLGGNDYAVLVEGMQAASDVNAVAEKLTQAMAAPFEVQGHEVFVSASIGVAICFNGMCQSGTLIESAEKAMSRVKQEGGGGHQFARDEPVTLTGRRLTLETSLRYALDRGELEVHYQPKVNLATGAITGAEALMRWNSPQLGWVSPAQFIPIAEETGLIVPIGAWILESACSQAARWREQGHDLRIAVNLSPRQFRQKDLATMVEATLSRCRLDARHLELEITESTAMTNAEQTIAVLGSLHRMGVRLSVDDFGTGYSSLSYLKRFPLHCLKIDRTFVSDATSDANGASIVRATVALAHGLGLSVIAEGIETDAQRNFLRLISCDEGQGYLFSKAVPAEAFASLLENRLRATAGPPAQGESSLV